MKPPTYDPIPPHVREAYELFRTAAEEAGFRVTPATLHTDAVLPAGEDRAIAFLDHVTRYWPTCGGGGLGLIGKSPVTLEEFVPATPVASPWSALRRKTPSIAPSPDAWKRMIGEPLWERLLTHLADGHESEEAVAGILTTASEGGFTPPPAQAAKETSG